MLFWTYLFAILNRLSIIDADNDKLKQQLAELRGAREEREKRAKDIAEPPKQIIKKDRRPIPGKANKNILHRGK